jgi:hypothetical protein
VRHRAVACPRSIDLALFVLVPTLDRSIPACIGEVVATLFGLVCFDPGNFNGVVREFTLIESLQISRLKSKSLRSAEIETTTKVSACA